MSYLTTVQSNWSDEKTERPSNKSIMADKRLP